MKVAGARNQAEAEFLQGLLREEGVPSTLRRTAGFDVPDFLAAGPRDVLVARSTLETARDVLLQSDLGSVLPGGDRTDPPWRVAAVLAAGLVVLALIVLLATL